MKLNLLFILFFSVLISCKKENFKQNEIPVIPKPIIILDSTITIFDCWFTYPDTIKLRKDMPSDHTRSLATYSELKYLEIKSPYFIVGLYADSQGVFNKEQIRSLEFNYTTPGYNSMSNGQFKTAGGDYCYDIVNFIAGNLIINKIEHLSNNQDPTRVQVEGILKGSFKITHYRDHSFWYTKYENLDFHFRTYEVKK